jgi:hypothetical protein
MLAASTGNPERTVAAIPTKSEVTRVNSSELCKLPAGNQGVQRQGGLLGKFNRVA